jgi:hypothetical protein
MPVLSSAKRLVHKTLFALGYELRPIKSDFSSDSTGYSYGNEDKIIQDLLGKIQYRNKFVVDIGAGDGEYMSNSYALFKAGWEGLGVEWNGKQFAKLAYRYSGFSGSRLLRARVTPNNVLDLLAACEVPSEFAFLSLDIDSYDHFVLEKLLTIYRPSLICAEINEKIPPPLQFTATFQDSGAWGQDHFYGQSVCMLEDLGKRNGYDLVRLEYNNAFLIRHELNSIATIAAADAWRQGYVDRRDRHELLPWNKDMEPLITLPAGEAKAFIRKKFERYEGHYILK